MNWHRMADPEKPRLGSVVLCWHRRSGYHLAHYGEYGTPGMKPGEGEMIFSGCHWATHWTALSPPSDPSNHQNAADPPIGGGPEDDSVEGLKGEN